MMTKMKYLGLVLVLAIGGCQNNSTIINTEDKQDIPRVASRIFPQRQLFSSSSETTKALETRSVEEIAQAACQSMSGWRCGTQVTKPKVVLAASSNSMPVIPASWTVPAWCYDEANVSGVASDLNACTSCAAPCRTFQEISVHRWGCAGNPYACPRLLQNTTIEALSSSSSATDLVYLYPAIEQNSYLNFFGPLGSGQQICTGTITVTTSKARTKGASSLLTATFPGGCTSAVQYNMVVNATHASVAYLNTNTSGTTWTVSQPLARVTAPWNGTDPAEVDTWATGDTVTVYAPVTSPIVAAHATTPTQTNSPGIPNLYITDIQIKQPSSTTIFTPGPNVTLNESRITGYVYNNVNSITDTFMSTVGENGIFSAAWSGASTPPTWKGGVFNASGSNTFSLVFEGGVIFKGTGYNVNGQINETYISTGATLINNGVGLGAAYPGQANNFIWGPGAFVVNQGSSFLINHTTATPCLLVSTTQLDFFGTGCGTSAAAPAVTNCNITVDGAHIDAAFGVAGGGGMLWTPSGANILTLNAPF